MTGHRDLPPERDGEPPAWWPRSPKALLLAFISLALAIAIITSLGAFWLAGISAKQDNDTQQATLDSLQALTNGLRDNAIASCERASDARQTNYENSAAEENFAVYMEAQAADPEVAAGWSTKIEYEANRQKALEQLARDVGDRVPGTVRTDCEEAVGRNGIVGLPEDRSP